RPLGAGGARRDGGVAGQRRSAGGRDAARGAAERGARVSEEPTDRAVHIPEADERVVEPELRPDDVAYFVALGPRTLAEIVGEENIKEQLALQIQGARRRGQPGDHLLFCGPPGLGMSFFAQIAAYEMGVAFRP